MSSLLEKAVCPSRSKYATALGKLPGFIRAGVFPFYKLGMPDVIELHGIKVPLKSIPQSVVRSFAFGNYESAERVIAEELVSPSDIVVELGGGCGYTPAAVAKKLNSKRIVVFEPNTALHSSIKSFATLNNVTVTTYPFALAPKEGDVEFVLHDSFFSSKLKACQNGSGRGNLTTVKGDTLEHLLRIVPDCTMVVMDVEGAEQFVHWNALPSTVRKVVLEFHTRLPHYNQDKILADLLEARFVEIFSEDKGRVRGFSRG